MCGINLVVSQAQDDLKPCLQRMLKKTDYRGPDVQGEFHRKLGKSNLALGANRLRIVDQQEQSDQPMVSACGNYVLVYNGEVYNYHDLKSSLLRLGQEFHTGSDTEVILYWLKHHGAHGLRQLKGMFALAFIDLEQEKILVARDRHGIKPLFYHKSNDSFIVSSSLRAIMATNKVGSKLDRQAVQDYLQFRHVLGQKTFYQDIYSVVPGTYLEYTGEVPKVNIFAQNREPEEPLDLREKLLDAVTLATATEEPAALLLSGGVDSTLLLAIIQRELGYHGFPTFTLNTGKDATWADKAAKYYKANHTLVEIRITDLERSIAFLEQMDQPVADHGALATWLIAEKAGVNHRVLLSGAGADELFAGYNRHRAFNSYLKHKKSWLVYKRIAKTLGYSGHPATLKRFMKSLDLDNSKTFKKFLQINSVINNSQFTSYNNEFVIPVNDLSAALDFDKQNYLVNDVLAITDLATMAHSMETRVPYLYDDVVWAAEEIPVTEKIKHKGKGPLKELLNSYGGKPFTRRPKMGFGLPMAEFMREPTFSLWNILQKDDPVFEFVGEKAILQMKKEHQSGKKDWNMQLWAILVLSYWLKQNIS